VDLFVYALTAGAFATLNPCGFSLLPASLGRFLARRGHGPGVGLVVGLSMGAGAFSAFAAIGVVLSLFGVAMGAYLP